MRSAQTQQFTSHDGVPLFYRYWPAVAGAGSGNSASRRAIVLLHRGHEHSGRLQHLADELALDDFALFAWDARGHGQSPGARGDSPSFAASVKDLDAFVRHIEKDYSVASENIALIAQSVGAVLAAAWAHDYAPRIRCMSLAAPAFKVKLYVPWARQGLQLLYKLRGNFFVNSYVKARFLTHDPERIASYQQDPLITRVISVRILLGLYQAAERVIADAQAITTPTQVLISGSDWVVRQKPQLQFFERLGAPLKELHCLPGFYHDTLGEQQRSIALDKVRTFIQRAFEQTATSVPLLDADQRGFSQDEEQGLRRPLPVWSPKRWSFAAMRLSMRTLGRLSKGIRLGASTGFDSGSTLDYVYRNRAEGITPLGHLLDRNYLNAVGWRGIRARKTHLEQAIAQAALDLSAQGRLLNIADIAAGHGRYVLDAIERLTTPPDAVLLRDYSELNVRAGKALIEQRGLNASGIRVRFEQGDAFDEQSLAALQPQPTLAIVSGLYELFPRNAPVLASLRGLAQALASGAYLIYTGQPWHPQLELIARTLTSHRNGQPWIMRRRSQAELDQLVASAGFVKCEQWIDEWGIFTVSLAVRA